MIIKYNFFRNTLHTYSCGCGSDACATDSDCNANTCDCGMYYDGNTATDSNYNDNSDENSYSTIRSNNEDSASQVSRDSK